MIYFDVCNFLYYYKVLYHFRVHSQKQYTNTFGGLKKNEIILDNDINGHPLKDHVNVDS